MQVRISLEDQECVLSSYVQSYDADDMSKLYNQLADEFGRCTGYVRRDMTSGYAAKIGWVFVKRENGHTVRAWCCPVERVEFDMEVA